MQTEKRKVNRMDEVVKQAGQEDSILDRLDAEQVQRVRELLTTCGIEPTPATLEALANAADQRYPSEPNRLEIAARSMLNFFAQQSPTKRELAWSLVRRWASRFQ